MNASRIQESVHSIVARSASRATLTTGVVLPCGVHEGCGLGESRWAESVLGMWEALVMGVKPSSYSINGAVVGCARTARVLGPTEDLHGVEEAPPEDLPGFFVTVARFEDTVLNGCDALGPFVGLVALCDTHEDAAGAAAGATTTQGVRFLLFAHGAVVQPLGFSDGGAQGHFYGRVSESNVGFQVLAGAVALTVYECAGLPEAARAVRQANEDRYADMRSLAKVVRRGWGMHTG